jgi:hypothetical protein
VSWRRLSTASFISLSLSIGISGSNNSILPLILQIVGADSCTGDRPEDQATRLLDHMNAVRKLRGLEGSRIVFCPESNLAFEGKRIVQDLARERALNVYCIREDKKQEGIRMTEALKKEMAISMGALLLQRKIRFHRQMVCVSNGPNDRETHTPSSMRKLIIDQLNSYQRELVPSKTNIYLPPKERYSGKRSGCDDHAIALQICWKSKERWDCNKEFYSRMKPIYDDSDLA